MTYYTRTEKQYKIIDWDNLGLGEYFWESDFEDLCIKVTPESFIDVTTKEYHNIDDIDVELSCCCEVFANVTWKRVYEEDK